jgi:hypothetical protein
MIETDLYLPVRTCLSSMGYEVRGEIGDIDVYAVKDDVTVAVEMKTRITLKLLYQAIERQKVCDMVYVALPKEAIRAHGGSMKAFKALLSRLSIGLIEVDQGGASIKMEAKNGPVARDTKKTRRTKKKNAEEFGKRTNRKTLGGTQGKKLTAYREDAVMIALDLETHGPKRVKDIVRDTAILHAGNILRDNHYGWFERTATGVYGLSDKGRTEHKDDYHAMR